MKSYTLKREIVAENEYDLIVAGGGPGGTAAAVCAARLGAKVLLLEAMGCLGGMGTSGLVTAFDPMADGNRALVGGFMQEVVETMYSRGFLAPQVTTDYWRKKYHCWTPYSAEGLKLILDEYTAKAGVEVRFFTKVIDADFNSSDRSVKGVIIHNIEGYSFVPAKTFIDATGDAVLAKICGVDCREAGHDGAAPPMPPTLCSLCSFIDWDRYDSKEGKSQQKMMEKAILDGHFSHKDKHLPGMFKTGPHSAMLNGGHVFGMDALNNRSLSAGMVKGRQLAQEYMSFYRKYVPGFENMEHMTTASLMGVRESRRIVGEYELNIKDYLARRQFPDQIGIFNKFVDIHVKNDSEEEYKRFCEEMSKSGRLGYGECFGIPYRILVPKGWKNLWVAGRCNSSDEQVHGSIRVMPAAAMMGQAAGTAAVQSVSTGQTACSLDTSALTGTLRKNGAILE
ncbi:MAG: fumarate reductase [Lentisphaerae bacterium GWF2_50_93]|nr:MAG: fumarate reductase [Lentisphaerae bacterium GWF2_50_93]